VAELQKGKRMQRGFAPLLFVLVMLGAVIGGAVWYVSSEPLLDWTASDPPNVAEKARGMIANRTLSTTITEAEVNALVKQALYERRVLHEYAVLTGADVTLSGDILTARTDILIGDSIRLQLTHRFRLEWQEPDLAATHLSSSLKDIPLPAPLLRIGVVRVPLALDERLPAKLHRVSFEEDAIRLTFRISSPFS
jgi:hypothetical protein